MRTHTGDRKTSPMGGRRRQRRQTFADLVKAVAREGEDAPARRDEAVSAGPGPGLRRDGTLVDPQGRVHEQVRETVSASRALSAAASGALVVWDPCGCGGGCGFRWLDPEEVAALVRSGPPRVRNNKRHIGNISEWHAADGSVLLLAEEAVHWGESLA
ncbi:hypothetical protein V1L54_01395 [Streptomyces sp. TRM 70361]|uniref:hypothetical protein n=1 Tax=Streptomyces sp. TRM 70361 TaxID=3116553 RepID=UPI002E7B8F4D|nr:hypothetical protein [Streptomyces sp. TRM 70361]MEE1938084.1 hypothetical protein [Streptomyces sp. TRM 70361]